MIAMYVVCMWYEIQLAFARIDIIRYVTDDGCDDDDDEDKERGVIDVPRELRRQSKQLYY